MLDLTVVIPAQGEGPVLRELLPELRQSLEALGLTFELLIVTRDRDALTIAAIDQAGGRLVSPEADGYGTALSAAWDLARGDYILTLDADLAGAPALVRTLWSERTRAEISIASRYAPGGAARMPMARRLASRALNLFFRRGLSVPIDDLSSGIRLYHARTLRSARHDARSFDILQQVIVHAYAEGWRVREVPFVYESRPAAGPAGSPGGGADREADRGALGGSHGRSLRLAGVYLRTFWALWKHRNSILAADYDDRAHDSVIPLQRYWQRSRHRHVTDLIAGQGPVLDVGCGSSRIIGALPAGSVAMDILRRKLRYARKFGKPLVNASGFALPLRDASFPCVLCSQVIEHVPKASPILDELCRVLAPGGRLVLGTPDYANWEWVWMEKAYGLAAPGGYADEHVAHYTYDELMAIFTARGFRFEGHRYILRGELIMAFRKPS